MSVSEIHTKEGADPMEDSAVVRFMMEGIRLTLPMHNDIGVDAIGLDECAGCVAVHLAILDNPEVVAGGNWHMLGVEPLEGVPGVALRDQQVHVTVLVDNDSNHTKNTVCASSLNFSPMIKPSLKKGQ